MFCPGTPPPLMMVTGGFKTYYSVELVYSTGVHLCFLTSLPSTRRLHTQTGVEICGGGSSYAARTSCITFKGVNKTPRNTINASGAYRGISLTPLIPLLDGSWQHSHTLGELRYGHTSWASSRGVLLMGGDSQETTTELLTDDGNTAASFTLTNNRKYNSKFYLLFIY